MGTTVSIGPDGCREERPSQVMSSIAMANDKGIREIMPCEWKDKRSRNPMIRVGGVGRQELKDSGSNNTAQPQRWSAEQSRYDALECNAVVVPVHPTKGQDHAPLLMYRRKSARRALRYSRPARKSRPLISLFVLFVSFVRPLPSWQALPGRQPPPSPIATEIRPAPRLGGL